MKTQKKNWETPSIIYLDGTKVESGVLRIPEGSHMVGSFTGSLPGVLVS